MIAAALIVTTFLATPPDHSKGYFPNLSRPPAGRVEMGRPPDGPVILIVVDAMRPDRLTPYGFSRPTTPNLAALADEGVIFTNYFVNGNWTRPTTASLLTGLPPAKHGVESDRDRLADQFVTLAELLSGVGAPTGAVVGNGNAGSAFGLSRGFQFYADTVKHWEGLPSAEQVVELAIPFVRQHAAQPFFLMLFFVDPHDPYHAPAPYEDMFVRDASVPLVRSPHWERRHYSAAQIERMQATYDGAVRYTDTVIGQFFEQLKVLGVYDKATIIVTSDHGEAFGEHGVFLHAHHMYDEIIRAPLIVRAPAMSGRGGYNHYLFQSIDLLPTIVGLYGAPVPPALPGVDILATLRDPGRINLQRYVVSEFHNFGIARRMVRSYTHKVIYTEPADETVYRATVGDPELLPSVSFEQERVALYDVAADPFERHDLYSPQALADAPWAKLVNVAKALSPARRQNRHIEIVEQLDPETRNDLRALGYIQ